LPRWPLPLDGHWRGLFRLIILLYQGGLSLLPRRRNSAHRADDPRDDAAGGLLIMASAWTAAGTPRHSRR